MEKNNGRKNEFLIHPNNENEIGFLFHLFSPPFFHFHSSPLLPFFPTKYELRTHKEREDNPSNSHFPFND